MTGRWSQNENAGVKEGARRLEESLSRGVVVLQISLHGL